MLPVTSGKGVNRFLGCPAYGFSSEVVGVGGAEQLTAESYVRQGNRGEPRRCPAPPRLPVVWDLGQRTVRAGRGAVARPPCKRTTNTLISEGFPPLPLQRIKELEERIEGQKRQIKELEEKVPCMRVRSLFYARGGVPVRVLPALG